MLPFCTRSRLSTEPMAANAQHVPRLAWFFTGETKRLSGNQYCAASPVGAAHDASWSVPAPGRNASFAFDVGAPGAAGRGSRRAFVEAPASALSTAASAASTSASGLPSRLAGVGTVALNSVGKRSYTCW